ncbi:MAG: DNA polymerase III subunit delta [Verrucomicrobiales bacterium]
MPPKTQEPKVPLVLVAGSDDYAVKQRAKAIFDKWKEETKAFDPEVLDASSSNASEAIKSIARLREALNTMPLFGGPRIIWFQNCNFLGDERSASASSVTEELAALALEFKTFIWKDTRLLISAADVDKRRSFAKTIDKLGTVETLSGWSIDDKDWAVQAELAARQHIKSLNKQISEEALGSLVANVGPNSRQLANEIEKLGLYTDERPTIELADVETIVSRNKQSKAFALSDALGNREFPRLLKIFDEEMWSMRTERDRNEIGILYGLITKVRTMLFLKEMVREKMIDQNSEYFRFKSQLEKIPAGTFTGDKKFNPLAMHPYMLHNSLGHSRKYSSGELVRAMELLLEANLKLISSGLDEAVVLQQTLIQIAQPQATEGALVN